MLELNNKSILITGDTGSFGKMFTKLILEKFPDYSGSIIKT
jgi:FlaA1/EpsC-like NDP-sugar epimerase